MIKRGISLIVLIITIIVVIILAAVVILTLSKNNPIESAKEARFKEDVRTFQDELALYISKQYTNAGGHWDENISATTYDEMKNYIPSFTKKYEGKFVINKNNLEYTDKLDEKEKAYSQNLNVNENVSKLLPDEFQQVEYIERNVVGAYLDTKTILTQNHKVCVDFEILEYKNGGLPLICARYGWLKDSFAIAWYDDGDLATTWGDYAYRSKKLEINKRYFIEYSKEGCFIDKEFVHSINSSVFVTPTTGKIFAYHYNSGGTGINNNNIGKVRIFKMTIYELNNLVKKFIPCYAITTVTDIDGKECSRGTIGLYDTVEGKFYTNQGVGYFIAGPDVDE